MNTLLDENKKLCLMNGEVIRMTDTMNMIFETHDLSRATAATISRCGMVYLESGSTGGWKALVQSWITKYTKVMELDKCVFNKLLLERVDNLFKLFFQHLSDSMLRHPDLFVMLVPMGETQMCTSFLRIFHMLMTAKDMREMLEDEENTKEEILRVKIDMRWIYAAMWSIGAASDMAGSKHFETELYEKGLEGEKIGPKGHEIEFKLERRTMPPQVG